MLSNTPFFYQLSIKVSALARRFQPEIVAGAVSGEMSWDERQTLVNRLRIPAEMRLSETQEAMAKSLQAFEEKKGELEQAVEVATAQRDSASKRHRAAAKDCKKADQ